MDTRPEFSMRITLEWAICFAIVGYLLVLSIYVWRKEKNGENHQWDSLTLRTVKLDLVRLIVLSFVDHSLVFQNYG